MSDVQALIDQLEKKNPKLNRKQWQQFQRILILTAKQSGEASLSEAIIWIGTQLPTNFTCNLKFGDEGLIVTITNLGAPYKGTRRGVQVFQDDKPVITHAIDHLNTGRSQKINLGSLYGNIFVTPKGGSKRLASYASDSPILTASLAGDHNTGFSALIYNSGGPMMTAADLLIQIPDRNPIELPVKLKAKGQTTVNIGYIISDDVKLTVEGLLEQVLEIRPLYNLEAFVELSSRSLVLKVTNKSLESMQQPMELVVLHGRQRIVIDDKLQLTSQVPKEYLLPDEVESGRVRITVDHIFSEVLKVPKKETDDQTPVEDPDQIIQQIDSLADVDKDDPNIADTALMFAIGDGNNNLLPDDDPEQEPGEGDDIFELVDELKHIPADDDDDDSAQTVELADTPQKQVPLNLEFERPSNFQLTIRNKGASMVKALTAHVYYRGEFATREGVSLYLTADSDKEIVITLNQDVPLSEELIVEIGEQEFTVEGIKIDPKLLRPPAITIKAAYNDEGKPTLTITCTDKGGQMDEPVKVWFFQGKIQENLGDVCLKPGDTVSLNLPGGLNSEKQFQVTMPGIYDEHLSLPSQPSKVAATGPATQSSGD